MADYNYLSDRNKGHGGDAAYQGPWVGTHEGHRLWCNSADSTGLFFATVVWISMLYALATVAVVYATGQFDLTNFSVIVTLIFLALWSHLKTMMSDPGAVPSNAHPTAKDMSSGMTISMCGRCDGYKPPMSHHDRISNRCVSRMDHFCPWMNNAIGAKNQKDFFLFLIYTDAVSVYLYIDMALHLIDYDGIGATPFTGVGLYMVRALIFVLLFAILFTSSMILNQWYGLATGLGTIDRMKLKADDPEDGTPVPFSHVFGVWWPAWFLPLDPVFDDYEAVFSYSLKEEPYSKL
jgi:hypothetical protein